MEYISSNSNNNNNIQNNERRHISTQEMLEKYQDIKFENVTSVLENMIKDNQELFNSSKGKHIVAFLGNTGSGKSTIVNFLAGKELITNNNDDIVLRNADDHSAMKIGIGHKSETFLPKFIKKDDLLFYDFPGFSDNRGPLFSLLNASFIKNIIEKAESVKIVFILSFPEILANRGELFKELSEKTKKLIPSMDIHTFSCIILSKTTANRNLDRIITIACDKVDGLLKSWVENDYINKMTSAEIIVEEKNEILKTIERTPSKRISNIDTSAIYKLEERIKIKEMFKEEIKRIFGGIIRKRFDDFNLRNIKLNELSNTLNYFQNTFEMEVKEIINSSTIIQLIGPLSQDIYLEALQEIETIIKLEKNCIISKLDGEIQTKNEELKRIKAENDKRELYLRLQQSEKEKEEEQKKLIQAHRERIQEYERSKLAEKQLIFEKDKLLEETFKLLAKKREKISYQKESKPKKEKPKVKNYVTKKDEFIERVEEDRVKAADLKNTRMINSLNKRELKKIKNEDLKYILSHRDLPVSGNKDEMVNRIMKNK